MFNFLSIKLRELFKKKGDKNDLIPLDELEKFLYSLDFGTELVKKLISSIQELDSSNQDLCLLEIGKILFNILKTASPPFSINENQPKVILFVGANGSGKTTTIVKLAQRFKNQNKSVLIGGTDTFRAAAREQLEFWTTKFDIPLVKGYQGGDPSAVAFDTIISGISRKKDVILIDTSGRMHTNSNLMKELLKIIKVCNKALPNSPHEIFMTLDSSIGQYSLEQAKNFHEICSLTGIIPTKLDFSSKGGIIFSIHEKYKIPIPFFANGEKIEDLEEFSPRSFIEKLLNIKLLSIS